MSKRVVLCVDGQSMRNPAMVGLAGEALEAFPWLECATDARRCRHAARSLPGVEEAWVVSCDDMEPINVAAALKRDDPCKKVYIVSCGQNGSMASRVANAGIDGLWSESQFLRRFAQVKRSCAGPAQPDAGEVAPPDAAFSPMQERAAEADDAAVPPAGSLPGAPMPMQAASPAMPPAVQQAASCAVSPASAQVASSPTPAPALGHRPMLAPPGAPPAPAPAFAGGQDVREGILAQAAALSARVASRPETSKKATVIAVASGSGGCGKSTVAALLALLASRCGLAAIALDADLQFGDLHYLLGVGEPVRIEEAIEEPARLARLREDAHRGKPGLLAACRRVELADAAQHALPAMLSELACACDVLVVNTGALWSDVHAAVLDAADATAFLMDCRPSSLRAAVHAVELCARLGVATTGFTFVVNRHERQSLLSAVDVSCSLRGAHAMEFPDGGRDVDELLGAGYADELMASGNPLIGAVSEFLSKALPADRGDAVARMAPGASRRRRPWFGRRR